MQPKTQLASGSGRDLRFDSLRGLMLVTMTLNHMPSVLRRLSDQYCGVFSSAEGFVFISGILAGFVYTRRRRRDGPAALRSAAQHRASTIYGWHVGAFLVSLVVVQVSCYLTGFCSWANPPLFFQRPWLAALLGSLLLYQPGLLDILPMYCAFVILLPAVLGALENGRKWRVLGLSFLAWFAVQWIPPVDGAPLYPIHVGSFNIFTWQFLFVGGAVIGHARLSPSWGRRLYRPAYLAAAAAVAIFGVGVEHLGWRTPGPDWLFGIFVNKPNLGLLRLANFGAAAYLVSAVGARFPGLVTWRPLAFLGQHSIAVVAAQTVALMIVLQFSALFATPLVNWTTTLLCIGFLFAVAAVHQAFTRWLASAKAQRRALALGVSRPSDAPAA